MVLGGSADGGFLAVVRLESDRLANSEVRDVLGARGRFSVSTFCGAGLDADAFSEPLPSPSLVGTSARASEL